MNTFTRSKPKTFLAGYQLTMESAKKKLYQKSKSLLFEKGLFIGFIGLLLGRAVILSTLSPFVIAFIASVWFLRRDKVFPLILFSLIGAATYSLSHSIYILLSIGVFFVCSLFIDHPKITEKILPVFVFFAAAIPRLSIYAMTVELTYLEWGIAFIEGIL